jgi:hypothetical protein
MDKIVILFLLTTMHMPPAKVAEVEPQVPAAQVEAFSATGEVKGVAV